MKTTTLAFIFSIPIGIVVKHVIGVGADWYVYFCGGGMAYMVAFCFMYAIGQTRIK